VRYDALSGVSSPVFVFPHKIDPPMSWLPKRTVVVPVDFSGVSLSALKTALDLVDQPANVHAVHLVVPLGNMSPGESWGAVDDTSRMQEVTDHFQEFLSKHGIEGVTTEVRLGDPGLGITEYAQECNAELIVITSHGRHGWKHMLLGSVAERVIRHAEIPVLVLRPDKEEE
jgi:nucleotide-binding universal stress UspA family protein